MKTIWINAGELSGDMQAAALLTALREREPELAAIGMGGPNLARAGQKNLFRVESLSVMGIMEVLTALPRALHMLSQIKKEMARLRPDGLVLVDDPGIQFPGGEDRARPRDSGLLLHPAENMGVAHGTRPLPPALRQTAVLHPAL